MREFDLVVIGGGPAGMAAAISARENGLENIIVLERDAVLGGILNQCIHNGFGLHTFKEELTGPEYAEKYYDRLCELEIPYETNTMVLDISTGKIVTTLSRAHGVENIRAKSVVLAMGCRERPRGALGIPGFRPQGIYTAGTAQRLINIEGMKLGREVVILGSGDIGLIMARRMTLEGAHVAAVFEMMPYSNGLNRNIVQCLEDYGIPLYLKHTVVDIKGKEKLEGVVVAEVDNGVPIPGTEQFYPCDTLLLSCGLIPENELSRACGVEINPLTNGPVVDASLETSIGGVFACGNVLHVHDLVDFVSAEAAQAGKNAAQYVRSGKAEKAEGKTYRFIPQNGVRYTVPNRFDPAAQKEDLTLRFRVTGVFKGASIVVRSGDTELFRRKMRVLIPSEMQTITVKKDLIEKVPQDVTVEIEGSAEI